jgi:hypothetical protein
MLVVFIASGYLYRRFSFSRALKAQPSPPQQKSYKDEEDEDDEEDIIWF